MKVTMITFQGFWKNTIWLKWRIQQCKMRQTIYSRQHSRVVTCNRLAANRLWTVDSALSASCCFIARASSTMLRRRSYLMAKLKIVIRMILILSNQAAAWFRTSYNSFRMQFQLNGLLKGIRNMLVYWTYQTIFLIREAAQRPTDRVPTIALRW